MKKVQVDADVLCALIRVYKTSVKPGDLDAAKMFVRVSQVEFTATRKLRESRKEKTDA